MSDLLYSELEEELRSGVRRALRERADWQQVLAWTESGETAYSGLWKVVAAGLGTAGLAVPEDKGGAGASWREVAVVLEELGRAAAPVPYFGSAVLGVAALLEGDDPALLEAAASGERVVTLAVPFGAHRPGPQGPVVAGVADAVTADVLLLPEEDGLYAYDASDVSVTPVVSLDQTRPLADLDFTGASGRRVAGPETAGRAWTIGAALLASEQLGVAEQCLETTVEYVKTRHQFARPIGSYQAVKHRLADLWLTVAQARAAARYAASCAATGDPDLAVAAAVAQSHCSEAALRAAEECVQLHGGIGFTWEAPAHLWLKRAKALSLALGAPHRHRATLAELVDLPL
ncbi:alkylation response protein AidB-like acyl-CoA dehydrogenase [Actinocorallia herbida]|uniref:Alkylation response protein AidB-like acyl-CoA dehydrogenase n=1 Tax=Actinocorallia herbida TaxID=58109 RepID=A0A3N1CTH8_9ACTN|nr:acyl-CoA dehydrogenase family protein [Actinocorallia herbida]ROO84613.1 alkylation response protein AidB-like acyl-CoA dehydrogenase [Actinocorallia herbida]